MCDCDSVNHETITISDSALFPMDLNNIFVFLFHKYACFWRHFGAKLTASATYIRYINYSAVSEIAFETEFVSAKKR